MSYFAIIDLSDTVVNVIAIEQKLVDTGHFGDPALFIQTSYNTRGGIHYGEDGKPDGGIALRKNYAGIGFKFDRVRDVFIPPQDYPSWTLNENTCLWEAPVPMPQDEKPYRWDEKSVSWIAI